MGNYADLLEQLTFKEQQRTATLFPFHRFAQFLKGFSYFLSCLHTDSAKRDYFFCCVLYNNLSSALVLFTIGMIELFGVWTVRQAWKRCANTVLFIHHQTDDFAECITRISLFANSPIFALISRYLEWKLMDRLTTVHVNGNQRLFVMPWKYAWTKEMKREVTNTSK